VPGNIGVHIVQENNYAGALVYDGAFFAEAEVNVHDADAFIFKENFVVGRVERDGIFLEWASRWQRFQLDANFEYSGESADSHGLRRFAGI
jgi:hypothetical protein